MSGAGRLIGFEHVGMAVADLDASLHFYCDLLGLKLVLRKTMPSGNGELGFLDTGNGQLELICPDPPVSRPAPQLPNTSAGIRHITFRFESVDAVFDRLTAAGVDIVERPRDAFNREIVSRVAFVHDPDGTIVELAE